MGPWSPSTRAVSLADVPFTLESISTTRGSLTLVVIPTAELRGSYRKPHSCANQTSSIFLTCFLRCTSLHCLVSSRCRHATKCFRNRRYYPEFIVSCNRVCSAGIGKHIWCRSMFLGRSTRVVGPLFSYNSMFVPSATYTEKEQVMSR